MAEFDLTAEITSALKSWSGDIADGLDELVDEEAKALKQDIVNDSPERTGDYKKAGKIDKKELGRGNTRAIVYNATNFQRTHLLEKGACRGRMAVCAGHPHIAPNEKNTLRSSSKRRRNYAANKKVSTNCVPCWTERASSTGRGAFKAGA